MDRLLDYYSQQDEDGRLDLDRAHRLEYLTTLRYLEKVYSSNSTILDACAGTGVYCFPLAGKGHIVTAGDLVPSNVDIIRKKQASNPILQEIYEGNILDLSRFKDESFDVVLCLGAFYHLHSEAERLQAIQECRRVAKKGGTVVIAYLNRFASFIHNFSNTPHNVQELLQQFCSGSRNVFYRSTPAEIEKLAEQCQITKKFNIATDGMTFFLSKQLEEITEGDFNAFLEYHYATCENENILGYSLHGLYIGEKTY